MYEKLEQLASLKLGRTIERLSRENATRMSAIIQEHAQRGLSQSGLLETAKLRSQLQMVKELCQEVHRLWLELILAVDKVLTEQSVAFIVGKVQEISINQAGNIRQNLDRRLSQAAAAELGTQVDRELTAVVATARRDLEILRGEQSLASSNNAANKLSDALPKEIESTAATAIAMPIKQPWTRDQLIALVIVILSAIAVLVAISTPEIRRKLGLEKTSSITQEKPTPEKPSSTATSQASPLQNSETNPPEKQAPAVKQRGNTSAKGHRNVVGNNASGKSNVVGNNNQVNSTAAPNVQINSAPGGIAIGGGTVINPTVINAPSSRNIASDTKGIMRAILEKHRAKVRVYAVIYDKEANEFAQQLYDLLVAAGWEMKDAAVIPVTLQKLWTGVRVGYRGEPPADEAGLVSIPDNTPQAALVASLLAAKISGVSVHPDAAQEEGLIELLVSSKPVSPN